MKSTKWYVSIMREYEEGIGKLLEGSDLRTEDGRNLPNWVLKDGPNHWEENNSSICREVQRQAGSWPVGVPGTVEWRRAPRCREVSRGLTY